MFFRNLKLNKWIVDCLDNLEITKPTEIQEKSLPIALNNNSLIISSHTGSGKTYCYLLPILNNINFSLNEVQCLIILPTKELTRQVFSRINDFKKYNDQLRIVNLIEPNALDKLDLAKNLPQIVVATPIKTIQLLKLKIVNKNVRYFVLDEADMLFDLGFTNTIDDIFKKIDSPSLIKFACSATLHESLSNKLKKYLKNTKVILNSQSIWDNPNISHNIVYSENLKDQDTTLNRLINSINPYFCIVFCNTKDEANKLYKNFINKGLNVGLVHKDLSTSERKKIYREINANKYQYLIATDLLSRGIDVKGADIVISYSMPAEDIWYIHRAGRCGRGNVKGISYVIYNEKYNQQINRLAKKSINWNFLFINKHNEIINKNLKIRVKPKLMFDSKTNNEIKKIINVNSKKIKPGYKKKIQKQIKKLKQKKKHEYIEKQVKERLLKLNIKETKSKH